MEKLTFGNKVKLARIEANLTQQELAGHAHFGFPFDVLDEHGEIFVGRHVRGIESPAAARKLSGQA